MISAMLKYEKEVNLGINETQSIDRGDYTLQRK